MKNQLENCLTKIIKYGLYAILLVPLAFWSRALYAFMTPKFILFQVLIEIIFVAWLILRLIKLDFGKTLKSDFNNWIVIALSSFIIVSFISAILGIDFSRSFWGIGARMTGLFAELHFFAWFLVLISFSSKSDSQSPASFGMIRYLNFSFFVALAMAAMDFYQNAGWALKAVWSSTIFNNPTFVAPYLIFHFFWGLYQAINPKLNLDFKRRVFGAGSFFILFVILLGQVRGAILGLFVGILLLGFFLIKSDAVNNRFKIIIAILFFLFFTGLFSLWVFRNSQFIQSQNISVFKRLTQFSLRETTAQTRILAWKTALKGFIDSPILGAGPENFNYIFNAHYNPSFLKFGGGGFNETWFDKPHNAFLEILTETGIIGSSVYLLIWLAVILTLFQLFKNGQKILSLILASAFTAYLGSIFFAFDSFGSWFGLYLTLGFLVSDYNANKSKEFQISRIASKYLFLTALIASAMLFALLYVNYAIWRANIADADALRIFPRNPDYGIIFFEKSLAYFSPYKSEYQFDLVASVAGAVEKGIPLSNLENAVNYSLGEADKAVMAHPKDAAKYTDMVRIYNILGTRGGDPEILDQAEAFGNKSLKLSPQRQETFFYLARTSLLKKNAKAAINWTKQAVLADPDVKQSHWYLGLAYVADNQIQEGVAEIRKAIDMGYVPQNQAERDFLKNLKL